MVVGTDPWWVWVWVWAQTPMGIPMQGPKHNRIVLEVLRCLCDNDLFVKPEKCRFRVTEVDFLSMIVSHNGIKMDPEKVNAILKWPEPTNVKQVHAFLGLSNFYRRFIKDYAVISRSMVDLTCKDIIFNFGDKEKALFEALKAAFTTAPMLQYEVTLGQRTLEPHTLSL